MSSAKCISSDPLIEKVKKNIASGRYVCLVTFEDLLTEDEIKKLREAAKKDARNLAMVDFHLLWGPRPSESAKLKIGDVEVTRKYIMFCYSFYFLCSIYL
jgi:integrase